MAKNTNNQLLNQVIYQIFTRNYKEGTFQAIEKDLDRIQALGVDIIYLLPIQPSGKINRKGSMGSPYAIQDYRAIDSVQGTMETFISLCDAIHQKGMKIMIDVVYNHTSPDSVLSKEHPEWFYHKPNGDFGNRVGEWWDVIDLDYNQKDLWTYQIDTLKMWAQYVDGFRCDVASLIPLDFWLQAREEVSKVKPDFIWLAESVDPNFIRMLRKDGINVVSDGELYQAFDILYDYDIFHHMTNAIQYKAPLSKYLDAINNQEIIYPANYNKCRFLENHDRCRATTLIPNETVLMNWTAWIYFLKGTTFIYAGQEFGVKHHPTLFDLDTVDFQTGKDYSSYFHTLRTIKKEIKGNIDVQTLDLQDEIMMATRNEYVGIFSTTGNMQSISIDLEDGVYTNLINNEPIEVFEKMIAFDGNPIILKK